MSKAEHYTYRVSWSPEDQEYVGTVAEMPSLSWLDTDQEAAFRGIRQLVADVLVDMQESGETPPEPIAERTFSGKFQVRIPPELHRQLALEAAEQNVSLNRLASKRLVGT
ncbi:type II toxin-antitoxin system HicB family antitoxin [Nesterenkonia sp.]|uniref:type II toxin-antitoxin system HicB family antitoxin n=1 Tax=Nesterenkonia sp. TaxID=704201 RepID=UPI00262B1697|nr:type II toxin-antitoxin system HicB family antitoxin [Nesterenkonia sp.]